MVVKMLFNLLCGPVLDRIDYRLFLTGASLSLGVSISLYAWCSTSYHLLLMFSAVQGIGFGAIGLGKGLLVFPNKISGV